MQSSGDLESHSRGHSKTENHPASACWEFFNTIDPKETFNDQYGNLGVITLVTKVLTNVALGG